MFGTHSTRIATIFGASIHTNLEAVLVLLATGLAADSWPQAGLIIASVGAAALLHVVGHWVTSVAYGKGIERAVFTRAGGIDFKGGEASPTESIVRDAAGPVTNASLALTGYLVLATVETAAWPAIGVEAVRIFALCNAALAVLNFLPALPLDGGLILRAALGARLGRDEAHRWVSRLSVVVLGAVATTAAFLGHPAATYVTGAMAYDVWSGLRASRGAKPSSVAFGEAVRTESR